MIVAVLFTTVAAAQTRPSCEVPADSTKANASRLCVQLEITDGRIVASQPKSVFRPSALFRQRLKIAQPEAEAFLFAELQKLLDVIPRPYRFALSDVEKLQDDKGQLNDESTKRIRTAVTSWREYLQLFEEWSQTTGKERGVGDVFPEAEATASGGLLFPLATAQELTALLIYEDAGYEAEDGVIRFAVADPIDNWSDTKQVQLVLPGVVDKAKSAARLQRIEEILGPLAGRPRCLDCITKRIEAFYRRLGLAPNLIFDNKSSSPLIINVIEGARIVGVSWLSLEVADENIDNLLYSLLTETAFRAYLKQRSEIRTQKHFNYFRHTGQAGPYLNMTRIQIQQLLVNQLGYSLSFSFAPNADEPLASNFNLTIQKNSGAEVPVESGNEVPASAPATANPDGVVTAHEQEKEFETEFGAGAKKTKRPKDKKHYLGFGIDYQPNKGVQFFGLGQTSRFPFLADTVNSISLKGGAQGAEGGIGSVNYFADFVLFNKLHRRVSVQLTVSSDLDPNRNLGTGLVDERRSLGFGRIEFEPFRDWSGSLLRFFVEGRHETVSLSSTTPPDSKLNVTTVDSGLLYLFESTEVENPRRIRFQPLLRMGLGLAVDEPRFNKLITTINFHQVLPRSFELDLSGRVEKASAHTPRFELPSFGGVDVVRGFQRDDGLGRRLWSSQNELWIPLPIGDESANGLKAMLREKVKLSPFFDIGGLYETVSGPPGIRSGLGLGLRFIYSPIIFKVDCAYGFGPTVNSGSRGKFYFSLGSNLPF